MNILKKLFKIANDLDSKGLYSEASVIDKIIKESFNMEMESNIKPIVTEVGDLSGPRKNLRPGQPSAQSVYPDLFGQRKLPPDVDLGPKKERPVEMPADDESMHLDLTKRVYKEIMERLNHNPDAAAKAQMNDLEDEIGFEIGDLTEEYGPGPDLMSRLKEYVDEKTGEYLNEYDDDYGF